MNIKDFGLSFSSIWDSFLFSEVTKLGAFEVQNGKGGFLRANLLVLCNSRMQFLNIYVMCIIVHVGDTYKVHRYSNIQVLIYR